MVLNPCWQMASCLTNVTGITAWHYSIIVGYIGETTQHLSTRIEEHLRTDKKAHVFTHLVNNETWKALSTENCFEIIDFASTSFRLKLKEAMHIIWKKPSLNKQQKHVTISVTV